MGKHCGNTHQAERSHASAPPLMHDNYEKLSATAPATLLVFASRYKYMPNHIKIYYIFA